MTESKHDLVDLTIDDEATDNHHADPLEAMLFKSISSPARGGGSPPWKSISFACGGWLQFYLYGVARGIQARGLDDPDVTYLGCSAGALAAVGLAFEGNFDDGVEFCKSKCLPIAHGEWTGLFRLHEYVSSCFDSYITPKFRPITDGTLQIAITRLPWFQGERATEFRTPQDLKMAILASAAAYPFASFVYRNGSWCGDGGLTDFQPVLDDDTLTVSPFYFSNADIKPSRYVPLWWAIIPPKSEDTIDWLYNLGYMDAMTYIDSKQITAKRDNSLDIADIQRRTHKYDVPRKVSMHRFLGYDLGNMTHKYFAFVCDFILLLVVLLIWKPMMLFLIYVELIVRMFQCLAAALIYELGVIIPAMCLSAIFSWNKSWKNFRTWRNKMLAFFRRLRIFVPSPQCKLREFSELFQCMFSLSLMLRFISPVCSRGTLRKHDRLEKLSLVYRIFRHVL
jgi:hypothetical protein